MTDHLGLKTINLVVAKLGNSSAITCVPRLDLDYFVSQYDSPKFNQRSPGPPAKNRFRDEPVFYSANLPAARLL